MPITQPEMHSIKAANPTIEDNLRSYLTADTNAGATSFTVLSNAGFSGTNFYVLIGEYGDEKAEIKLVSSFTGNVFTCGALTNSHEASDPVTFMQFNQIRFYGMVTEAEPAVDAAPLATRDLDCSQLFTEYTYEGSTYSYFCTAYYNSTSEKLSGFSEIISHLSFTRKSIKRIIESALRKAMTKIDETIAGDLNWDVAMEIVQDGSDEILARKRKWPFLRKRDTSTTTVAGTAYVAKPADLSLLEYVAVNSYKLDVLSMHGYLTRTEAGTTVTSNGTPTHYTEKENRYYFYPTPDGAYTVAFDYYKVPSFINDLSTEIDNVFVPILIYYAGSQFAYVRGNDKRGDKLYQMFEKLLEQQCVEFSGPESSDAEYVEETNFIATDYDLGIDNN
jgi:hypothetical protein